MASPKPDAHLIYKASPKAGTMMNKNSDTETDDQADGRKAFGIVKTYSDMGYHRTGTKTDFDLDWFRFPAQAIAESIKVNVNVNVNVIANPIIPGPHSDTDVL